MELLEMARNIVSIIFKERDKTILILTHDSRFRRKTLEYLVREIEHPSFKFKNVDYGSSTIKDDRGNRIFIVSANSPSELEHCRALIPNYVFLDYMVEEWMNKWEYIKMIIARKR